MRCPLIYLKQLSGCLLRPQCRCVTLRTLAHGSSLQTTSRPEVARPAAIASIFVSEAK